MELGWCVENTFQLRNLPFSSTQPLFSETDWVFQNRLTFPSASEQYQVYLECGNLGQWTPTIFCLAELKAQKNHSGALVSTELKDFKELDGYFLWKSYPAIFDSQVRALLRTSYYRKAWIALPRLRKKQELNYTLKAIETIMDDLNSQRNPFDRYPKVGVKVDSLIALKHIEDFLLADFLIFDWDSLTSQLLGINHSYQMLLSYLSEMDQELETFLHWLEPVPFNDKWCGFISRFPAKSWRGLGSLPWEAYFQRRRPEIE